MMPGTSFALILAISITSAYARQLYHANEEKGYVRLKPNLRRYFLIPAGQCTGRLGTVRNSRACAAGGERAWRCTHGRLQRSEELRCSDGTLPLVIHLDLTDAVPYPQLNISNKLDGVSILRAPDGTGQCTTEADLNVSLYCSRYSPIPSRRSGSIVRVSVPSEVEYTLKLGH